MKKTIFHFVKSNYLTGVENVVINICTLVKGYNYTVVSTKGPLDKYLEHYGINHITIPDLNPITILNVIKKYNPDIVQAHDAKMTVLLSFSGFYCHRHHIRMISELHNNDPKMHKWWNLRAIIYFISLLMYSRIIAVSKDTARAFAYFNLIKSKMSVIRNIINPYRIKEQLLPQNKVNKKWDCIFIGRFAYQKNPFKFVKIIYYLKKRYPSIKAVMLGAGPLLNQTKLLSKRLKIYDNIMFVGFQSNPYKYLQQSKILVITSKYEGLPLVSLESLLIGDPVVSTPIKGLKNIFNGICGKFAKNYNNFIDILTRLITNEDLYKASSKDAYITMRNVNVLTTFIESYKYIYNC